MAVDIPAGYVVDIEHHNVSVDTDYGALKTNGRSTVKLSRRVRQWHSDGDVELTVSGPTEWATRVLFATIKAMEEDAHGDG